ncbi:MAG: FlaA1/EpsC-like NDP-sugar epimerase [Flavobacteriales bacterium]|jgi:FlaA1/EpsC-like NDP-sugar epimerase
MINSLRSNPPRWMIFIIDLLISLVSLQIAYQLRFNFEIPEKDIHGLLIAIPVVLSIRAISFLWGRVYAGIVRYTGAKDTERIFIVISLGTSVLFVANGISFLLTESFLIPTSVLIIDWLVSIFVMVGSRLMVKFIHFEVTRGTIDKSRIVIFGAGESGHIAQRTLRRDAGTRFKVVAFVDDSPKGSNIRIDGTWVRDGNYLEDILVDEKVDQLILSPQNMPSERKREVIELCLKHHVMVRAVPPISSWAEGELSFKQLRQVRIEDLLERSTIKLNRDNIAQTVKDRVVLVSGAAGSIGSELVRQICGYGPMKILLVDQAESPLYDLEIELKKRFSNVDIEPIIVNIRNATRTRKIFELFKVDVVFHAAAYKHVPMMEHNPAEAVLTNVQGTRNLADLSHEFKVNRFVMVSTDKAVNPTNVMGASKRAAETYCQSLDAKSETRFVTTRFGNVLGSNGSVIPLFRRQIEQGGPLTVTHQEVTRYFMTIPEAAQLVLEAGAMGNGGEIYIFDMGKPVKIIDLARKMIRLHGLEPDKDIAIKITGLRPGEKLYEELLNNQENTLPTHNPQIMVAKVTEYSYSEVNDRIVDLINTVESNDNMKLVAALKVMIPEYVSNNSEFEQLDHK